MKLTNPELQSRLAAEYVLGTLTGAARRRFQEYLQQDAGLREQVARWEAYLIPLNNRAPDLEPPARVWQKIQRRMGDKSQSASNKIGFWARFGLPFSSAAAAVLITATAISYLRTPQDISPMLTAVLEEKGEARLVIDQTRPGLLMVKLVKPWQTSAVHSHELWVIPVKGNPRSLGVINSNEETRIALNDLDSKLADGAVFAISVEPKGGSPTGQPTGDVICKGAIARPPAPKIKSAI